MSALFYSFFTAARKFNCKFSKHLIHRPLSTIYALSSGYSKSGVAVIRISGERSRDVIMRMVKFKEFPKARVAHLKTVFDPQTNESLDKGIVLWFPEPNSFTGEDVCELHVHGSKAVIEALMVAFTKLGTDFRPAEPGEFTKRSFYNGKLDLVEVEGLADLIDSETEMQRKQALLQMDGSLSEKYRNWRAEILKNLSFVEAYIDFSEEENVEDNVLNDVKNSISQLQFSLDNHLNDQRRGELLRDGIKVAIVGSPNVGKSSLLNLLCERPAAIVTEMAGTTRDVLETRVNVAGYPVLIADTAGIWDAPAGDGHAAVEREGIRRSRIRVADADFTLLLTTANELAGEKSLVKFREHYVRSLQLQLDKMPVLTVINKTDLLQQDVLPQFLESVNQCNGQRCDEFVAISCKTQYGMDRLLSAMTCHLAAICGAGSTGVILNKDTIAGSRTRHRHHLSGAASRLRQFMKTMATADAADEERMVVLAAEHLRAAARHIGALTGHVTSDEILDTIFSSFCIGK